MCGRFVQARRARGYVQGFPGLRVWRADEGEYLSWNVPPSLNSWIVRAENENEISLDRMKWGFPGRTPSALVSNARSETAAASPMFSLSWARQRCLVPVDGWFEWKAVDGRRIPFYFTAPSGAPIMLAGLWREDRFVILTAQSFGRLKDVHHRRPVALGGEASRTWLEEERQFGEGVDLAAAMMAEEEFSATPVGDEVNKAGNDGAQLLVRRGPEPTQISLAL